MRIDRVTEGVYRLLDEIVAGTFPEGEALPGEIKLAEYLEVSRPTSREIVRTLANRGVVEVIHGRGTFVQPQSQWTDVRTVVYALSKQLDKKQVGMYLTQLRRMIEVGSAGLAAYNISDSHLERMRGSLQRYKDASERDDSEAATIADVDFHDAILDATGNPFLRAMMLPLKGALASSRLETNSVEEIRERAIRHHERILAAIEAGDTQAAKDAMRGHMGQTFDDIKAYVEGADADFPFH
ncbi:FadR/GntR family transcriptional regulator [Corynebacterium sp.]|uniref:FadR/GntR family transcriptional regulator n=1 Tax=Corynebacterium sp. TaxID=1720 RepID=UPI0026DCE864|nr:FadR/GntR family transcriptional regulator [Corynebacterium sp.]MDO5031866.1 FadR/GntR family transcriptional regulator [Corynebacterium sp.]